MSEIFLVALIFAVLLGAEWRFQLRSVRIGVAALAILVLAFGQPNYSVTVRRVGAAAPGERVTQLRGSPVSEYESGVLTMYQAIDEAADARANIRILALGVLVWLACSPALRHRRNVYEPSNEAGGN